MKQLYDVDKLFNRAEDAKIIRQSFINIATRELKYRKMFDYSFEDVLEDIRDFCLDIILLNQDHMRKIATGIRKLSGYILERKFSADQEVLIAASKVLYLVDLIKNGNEKIERYTESYEDFTAIIPEEYKKRMKKIQKYNKEAYYYILKSLEQKEE